MRATTRTSTRRSIARAILEARCGKPSAICMLTGKATSCDVAALNAPLPIRQWPRRCPAHRGASFVDNAPALTFQRVGKLFRRRTHRTLFTSNARHHDRELSLESGIVFPAISPMCWSSRCRVGARQPSGKHAGTRRGGGGRRADALTRSEIRVPKRRAAGVRIRQWR